MKNKTSRLLKIIAPIAIAAASLLSIRSGIASPENQIAESEVQAIQESKPSDEPNTRINYQPESMPASELAEIPKNEQSNETYRLWVNNGGAEYPILFKFQTYQFESEESSKDNPLEELIKIKVKSSGIEPLTTRPGFHISWETQPINEFNRLGPNDYEIWRLFEDPYVKSRALAGLRDSVNSLDWVRELKGEVPDLTGYNFYESNNPIKTDQDPASEKEVSWFELNASAGFRASLGKGNIPIAGLYTDLKQPSFLGHTPITRARISLSTTGELELKLQKELELSEFGNSNWIGEFATQAGPLGISGRISLLREIQNQSRLGISAGGTQKGASLGLDYIWIY